MTEDAKKRTVYSASGIMLRLISELLRNVAEFHAIAKGKFFQKRLFTEELEGEESKLVLSLVYLQEHDRAVDGLDEVVMDSLLASLRSQQSVPPVDEVVVNLLRRRVSEDAK